MADMPSNVVGAIAALTARERLLIRASQGVAVTPGDQLGALLDTIRALGEGQAAHALIGGVAVGIRAQVPRATIDVDVAVATSVSRQRVAEIMSLAGFELRGEFAHSLNFRHSSGEPVQVAFDPAFDAVIERAEPVEVGDMVILVASTADLIAMKRRAADDPSRRRSKALRDLADVELLCGDVQGEDEGW